MVKSVAILGSTGSVGKNTLELIAQNPDKFRVEVLTANGNSDLLIEQAKKFKPKYVCAADAEKIKAALPECKIVNVEEAAEAESDIVISAIVGFAGLLPTMKAISRGAQIGLANKESLVCAGSLIIEAAKKSGAKIIPVDSEHNAIFQLFDFVNPGNIEKVTLTASGGPFLRMSAKEMENVTPEQAVNHPNWKMGSKISVDSATMMNKGLELIEAFHLFPISIKQLEVIVHPESIVHSLVTYKDSSVLMQAANPDMKVPIAYALAYPERLKTTCQRLDLAKIGRLNFEAPDLQKFPCLALAQAAMEEGDAKCIALNAANEVAVEQFLRRKLGFMQIAELVANVLAQVRNRPISSIADVFAQDSEARNLANNFLQKAA